MANSSPKYGYPKEFFTMAVPQKYICSLCGDVLFEPLTSDCGCRYCSPFFRQNKDSVTGTCPTCGDTLNNLRTDDQVEMGISQLTLRCFHRDIGCPESFRVGELDDHLKECKFKADEFCMNLGLLSAEPHIIQGAFHHVEQNSRALPTEQVTGLYKKMEEERRSFEETVRGLTDEVRTRDMRIQRLESRLVQQETKLSRVEAEVTHLKKISYSSELLIEIKDYTQKKAAVINGPGSFYTDEFYTDRHGYKMCARIYLDGDGVGKGSHLSIFFAIKKGPFDNYLKWPFQRRVNFILINQDLGKEDIKDAFRPDATSSSFQKPTKEMNIASGCPMFVSHKVLENPRGGFIKNNTICLKVVVESP